MPGRMILLAATTLLLVTSAVSAQDLGQYDPAGYSGGYAEGASGPLGSDQLYPFDAQETWQHGYIQYMPFYGGYKHFRPYNYKNVLSQTQTAAGWGMSPKMPYSQQFWHRYQDQARLGHAPTAAYQSLPAYRQPTQQGFIPQQQYVPTQQFAPSQQFVPTQPVPAQPQRGGALQFTPAPAPVPTPATTQPHTGVSYQTPVQPMMIQSPNGILQSPNGAAAVPQYSNGYSQQPLLIVP